MDVNRRIWLQIAGGAAASGLVRAQISSAFPTRALDHGVALGAQSYSYRDLILAEVIAGYQTNGLALAELWQGTIEPPDKRPEQRAALRKWRSGVSLSEIDAIRRRFADAGVTIYAYNCSFRKEWTDAEIDHGFEIAKALGTDKITASSVVSLAPKIDEFAKKHKVFVGFHNHARKTPDEFARPEDFMEALQGRSSYMCINLDIGHFVGAGYDPLPFLKEHHERILTLHVKDMKKLTDEAVPFGSGDTPVREVLRILAANRWRIPAMVEYEYRGSDTVAEVGRCVDYCRSALA